MILGDFHLHTAHSEDSDTPMEQQIEAGIKAGLKYMCITEHMDMDFCESTEDHKKFEVDTDTYYKHYLECREKYADKIDVRFGIEYGLQNHLPVRCREYINSYPFDFVIGSQHMMDGMDVYYPEYYKGKTEIEAYRHYFDGMLENITLFDDYDVLGHVDYIVRYGPNKNSNYFYKDYKEVLDEILRQVIHRGKGIELNTGGYRSLGNEPNPSSDILKRYLELGGEIITIGSDAHDPANVAYEFDRAEKLLKELGYEYYCIFKDRKPSFISL